MVQNASEWSLIWSVIRRVVMTPGVGGVGGGGGGGGVLLIFLGGGVLPGPENPYPISDQNIRFSIPYFRPDSHNVYPTSNPVMCGKFGNSQ